MIDDDFCSVDDVTCDLWSLCDHTVFFHLHSLNVWVIYATIPWKCSFMVCQQHLLCSHLWLSLSVCTSSKTTNRGRSARQALWLNHNLTVINAEKMSFWMAFNFLLWLLRETCSRECQNSPCDPANNSERQKKKKRFSLKSRACQAPHCCYKSASPFMSCVDNIPTVFAAAPCPCFLYSKSWWASN